MGCKKLNTNFFNFLEIVHTKKRVSPAKKCINYYLFGLKHKDYNTTINGRHHKYVFGGKEQQNELGPNWYDITARNYDPTLGRWMSIDPLAEQMRRHSPYNYAFDNPIFFIDRDGMAQGVYNGGLIRSKKDLENSIENGFGDKNDKKDSSNDWYRDEKGNLRYDEDVNNQKDVDELHPGGKYVGKTVKEKGLYFSLFGDILKINTLIANFTITMDQALFRYIFDLKNPEWDPDDGQPVFRYTNFDIGMKFSTDPRVPGSKVFNYGGAKAIYKVYGTEKAMEGRF